MIGNPDYAYYDEEEKNENTYGRDSSFFKMLESGISNFVENTVKTFKGVEDGEKFCDEFEKKHGIPSTINWLKMNFGDAIKQS